MTQDSLVFDLGVQSKFWVYSLPAYQQQSLGDSAHVYLTHRDDGTEDWTPVKLVVSLGVGIHLYSSSASEYRGTWMLSCLAC